MGQDLKNKVIFITGASSGIGMACAKDFVDLGARVIMTARRLDKMKAFIQEHNISSTQVYITQLDIRDPENVEKTMQTLPEEWKHIDILINNAGLALTSDPLHQGDPKNWDAMIDTNVKGLLYVTKAVLPNMVKRDSGHIINIGSIAGRYCYPGGNVYAATKYAVRAISESLRIDLLGTKIRVSEVAPGAVETEFSEVRWSDKEKARAFYSDFTPLIAEDIADAVVYCATRRPHVNISEIVVMPVDQASISLIHRRS